MRGIWELFLREIRLITAEKSLLLTLLIAPILYAFLYGSIYLNKDISSVKIAIVDEDQTALSRLLTTELSSSRKLELQLAPTEELAKQWVQEEKVQAYLVITKGLENKITKLKQAHVRLVVNSAQFLPSSAVLLSLNEVVLTVSAGIRKTYFEKQGLGSTAAMTQTNPIRMIYRPLYNVGRDYGTFLIPGLLAIILQQTLLIGLCAAMAGERERGGLADIRKRYNFSQIAIGKGLVYWLVFMLYGGVFVSVNFPFLNADFRGSQGEMALVTGVFLAAVISMGFLIGSFFKNILMTFQIMGFSSNPIFLISGYSLPSEALPQGIQLLADCLPTTPYLKTLISIVQSGGSLAQNSHHLLHLALLLCIYSLLLLWRYLYLQNKAEKRATL